MARKRGFMKKTNISEKFKDYLTKNKISLKDYLQDITEWFINFEIRGKSDEFDFNNEFIYKTFSCSSVDLEEIVMPAIINKYNSINETNNKKLVNKVKMFFDIKRK